ncbi:hypothetical protein ACJ8JY_13180 [Serratia sp. CY54039]|uniref:hypothetical protein n=1 Tax=unclassified Serratia (in: enterobacteria) TaxID=2647522 RepID=UPI003FA17EE2
MRAHRDVKKKLYRRESVTSRGPIASGGKYRWERHGKQADDEQLPLRESMHGQIQHGMNYTPLLTSFDNLSAIKEVSIGPNCRYTQADVEALLLQLGLPSVRVAYSSGYNRYRMSRQLADV